MAKTAVKRTGYTASTPKHYLINAGAIYKNLTWNKSGGDGGTGQWEGELLGATSGGNKVTIEQNYRVVEVDGVFTPAVGQKVLESQTAKLETNVKEITVENIRLAINGEIKEADGTTAPTGYKVISGKSKLENTDYIENLGIVGTMSGTNDPIIVIIDNALCTSGLDFETKDNEEAVISMTFEAHADEGQVDDLSLPCRIYFPNIA
ncbi:hypothetical protein [Streptococcus suis]|uniref:Uncharacterized protein n=1 Tax=Streptococcus suis TaxID=1307 RepID=A0A0Z8UVC2_STRSU|nr:hypothetical protein [Streptococcus suis]MCG9921462.1 hypothetical protein [Streptococcus suis]MCG9925679.1 hypothetical protein [Streptococcus suis]MCG9927680.1 hypothetical protein [Streptococcus suis]MCG9929686.1 hypothetical protein [Streptococcus suis]MCG9936026.1 hypothetical protein [Streptococcus suis]